MVGCWEDVKGSLAGSFGFVSTLPIFCLFSLSPPTMLLRGYIGSLMVSSMTLGTIKLPAVESRLDLGAALLCRSGYWSVICEGHKASEHRGGKEEGWMP